MKTLGPLRIASIASIAITALVLAGCSAAGAEGDEDTSASEDEIVATVDGAKVDLKKTTHILLIGDSHKLEDQPLQAASTRARRYAQLYPQDQVVYFITKEMGTGDLAKAGVREVTKEPFGDVKLSDLSTLESDKLIAALAKFRRIASIDFFGHSSPFGALLESAGNGRTLGTMTPSNIGVLKDRFARDTSPYVMLHGCNGAIITAKALSKLWQIPVGGALTGSNFQTLRSDGRWYFNDEGFFPPGTTEVLANDKSFGAGARPECKAGACVRIKPQDSPYRGIWANPETGFQFGLGYYKFFCNYESDPQSCAKGMARSLHAFPSTRPIDSRSSGDDMKEVLADFFCNGAADPKVFDTCKTGLFAAAASGAPFSPMKSANDYSLECDFTKCQQVFRCDVIDNAPQQKTCVWVDAGCRPDQSAAECRSKNTSKQTTTRELKKYLEGQQLLRAQ
jgi:hypothetical protein